LPGVCRKLAFVLAAYGGALAFSGVMPALFVESAQGNLAGRAAGLTVLFAPGAVTLEHGDARVKLEFIGASRSAIPQGFDAQPARVNLLRGGAPPAHLKTWGGVIYRDLYPGVTLRFIARNGRIESEYLLAPGADPRRIRLRYRGARPRLDGAALALDGFDPSFRETIPGIYEFSSRGARAPVAGGFAIARSGVVGFRISRRHPKAPLMIDPAFSFAANIGGGGTEKATGVALDGAGAIYVAGYTDSPDFPGGGASRGGVDAFVMKFDPTGANVVYATYFGGAGDDRAFGIAVDAQGRAHIAGWTTSPDLPVVSAQQTRLAGAKDAFVAKLDPAGATILFSTYLGGSGADSANAIALHSSGDILIAGETASSDFPTRNALQASLRGSVNAFIARLDTSGALQYSTYLGGAGADRALAITADAIGNAYVTGSTVSLDFPLQNPFQRAKAGVQNAFVAKLAPAGTTLLYSTYLGGSGTGRPSVDAGNAIGVDPGGNMYIAGVTNSADFPTTNAFQSAYLGLNSNAFITKIGAPGGQLLYSTFLGGSSLDEATALRVDASGNAFVAGYTSSSNFPVANPSQANLAGGIDAWVAQFGPAGDLRFSSFYGGQGNDAAFAIAGADPLILAGETSSPEIFPSAPPAGGLQAFMAALRFTPLPGTIPQSNMLVHRGTPATLRLYRGGSWFENSALNHIGVGNTTALFGLPGDLPVSSDWSNSGSNRIGIFRNGFWFVDFNGNGQWDNSPIDRIFFFGVPGDVPVVGDWDGSGKLKIGVYRNGFWFVDYNGNNQWDGAPPDRVYFFGLPGDVPVVGDWDGSGKQKIGVFRNGFWFVDYNGNGQWDGPLVDRIFFFGQPGDVPVVGDWDGSGKLKIGVFRAGAWYVDWNGDNQWDPLVDKIFGFIGR
jgi:hypothetical protein